PCALVTVQLGHRSRSIADLTVHRPHATISSQPDHWLRTASHIWRHWSLARVGLPRWLGRRSVLTRLAVRLFAYTFPGSPNAGQGPVVRLPTVQRRSSGSPQTASEHSQEPEFDPR